MAADPKTPAPDADVARRAAHIAQELRHLMWNPTARRVLNDAGVHLTRANFYSSLPSLREIAESFEYAEGPPPYDDSSVFDPAHMRTFLQDLMPFAAEFTPPADGDVDAPKGFFWNNPAFSFADAMAYWCMLRRFRPATVLEVGSGFSTLIACEAVRRNGTGRVVCVEPFPKPWLGQLPIELVQRRAQDLDLAFFHGHLEPGSVLFLDSTHTVKTGSDCLHLYLRILPRLDRHLYVHVHDIFLPAGYPRAWLEERDVHWTEQYLLLALLLGNPSLRVLFGSNYHALHNRAMLDAFLGGRTRSGGGSFWFERLPQA